MRCFPHFARIFPNSTGPIKIRFGMAGPIEQATPVRPVPSPPTVASPIKESTRANGGGFKTPHHYCSRVGAGSSIRRAADNTEAILRGDEVRLPICRAVHILLPGKIHPEGVIGGRVLILVQASNVHATGGQGSSATACHWEFQSVRIH